MHITVIKESEFVLSSYKTGQVVGVYPPYLSISLLSTSTIVYIFKGKRLYNDNYNC